MKLKKIFFKVTWRDSSHQFWLCSSFPWSTLISWISCLLSTILLSIIMYSEEMSIAFQCVYNTCPRGIQPLFSLLRSPAAIFNTKNKIKQHTHTHTNGFSCVTIQCCTVGISRSMCVIAPLRISTMWDHCKHEKDALCTCYLKVNVKACKLRCRSLGKYYSCHTWLLLDTAWHSWRIDIKE